MQKKIHSYFATHLEEVEKRIQELSSSNLDILNSIGKHIFFGGGKKMRPILLLSSLGLFSKSIDELAYNTAALTEILHTSSLVHDDVVDNASKRRGKATINAMLGNRVAVLSGDFLISNAFLKAYPNGNAVLMNIMLSSIRSMCEGELIQLTYSHNSSINKQIYYSIIENKTASLFANSCKCGSYIASAEEAAMEKLHEVGRLCGMAFQIKDDLVDINPDSLQIEGKEFGNDLKEGKITLPVLYYLETLGAKEKEDFFSWLKSEDLEGKDEVLGRIANCGAVEYCREKMNAFCFKAKNILENEIPSLNKSSEEFALFRDIIDWICL